MTFDGAKLMTGAISQSINLFFQGFYYGTKLTVVKAYIAIMEILAYSFLSQHHHNELPQAFTCGRL